uniref:Uncharacterized protein n=1 Tax=Anguilla anguilla TaxID=7936 RepID=A0A0E9VEW6_ANGAN
MFLNPIPLCALIELSLPLQAFRLFPLLGFPNLGLLRED